MGNSLTIIDDNVRNIAYAYNLCVVLSKQIIDFEDKYYLQQVYSEILNNINLENFPKDAALCEALKSLLTTLGCIDDIEDQRKAIEAKYQRSKKKAVWSAVPSPSIILTGGTPAGMAMNALLAVGTSFMNYKRQMITVEEEKIEGNIKLEKQRKDALKANRLRLFQSAWELSADHPIPDALRLSENDVDKYNEVLKDTDIIRRYERLYDMKARFEAYPPFWFNLGETAREIFVTYQYDDYKDKAIEAFETFDRIHFEFLRQDIFAASCAISHISLLNPDTELETIKVLLQKAIHYSRDNYDLLQQCVPIALRISDIDSARSLLRLLTNEGHSLDINGKLLSLIYNRFDCNRREYDILVQRIGQANTIAWIDIKPQFEIEQFNNNMRNGQLVFEFHGGDSIGES